MAVLGVLVGGLSNCHVSTNLPNGFCGLMQEIISYLINTPMALYFAVGVFSLCIGSFLNVVIYRTPKMMEQEWRTDCQFLLHPEQPIIDETKLTFSKPALDLPQMQKCHTLVSKYPCD